MNTISKLLLSGAFLICAALSCLLGPSTASANVTIPYTGAAFTQCYGSYSTDPSATQALPGPCAGTFAITGSMSFTGRSPYAGWDAYDFSGTGSGDYGGTYSLTDGSQVSMTQRNSSGNGCDGCVELYWDPSQRVFTAWDVNITCASCGPGGTAAAIIMYNCPAGFPNGCYAPPPGPPRVRMIPVVSGRRTRADRVRRPEPLRLAPCPCPRRSRCCSAASRVSA